MEEVFYYEWTYTDFLIDTEVTRRSEFKVTRNFVEDRKKNNLVHARYRIVEDSKEVVDSSAIAEGKYIPPQAKMGL